MKNPQAKTAQTAAAEAEQLASTQHRMLELQQQRKAALAAAAAADAEFAKAEQTALALKISQKSRAEQTAALQTMADKERYQTLAGLLAMLSEDRVAAAKDIHRALRDVVNPVRYFVQVNKEIIDTTTEINRLARVLGITDCRPDTKTADYRIGRPNHIPSGQSGAAFPELVANVFQYWSDTGAIPDILHTQPDPSYVPPSR